MKKEKKSIRNLESTEYNFSAIERNTEKVAKIYGLVDRGAKRQLGNNFGSRRVSGRKRVFRQKASYLSR